MTGQELKNFENLSESKVAEVMTSFRGSWRRATKSLSSPKRMSLHHR